MRCCNQIVSKVLPVVVNDFLPPSEILNRVIAEFMTPSQAFPELMAPVLSQACCTLIQSDTISIIYCIPLCNTMRIIAPI